MNISQSTKVRLPIKGGCVFTCIVDVDVTLTLDEIGVGAMVDCTDAEDKKYMVILVLNMSDKEKPYTTQIKLQLIVWGYFIRHRF